MRKVFVCFWLAGTVLNGVQASQAAEPLPAGVAIETPACKLLRAHEIEIYLGGSAVVEESSGKEASASRCSWTGGSEDATVTVMLFAGAGNVVPEGTERAHFEQMIEAEKRKVEPGELVAVPELADDAWVFDLSDNPTQYFAVYVLKGKDYVTVSSNGIGLEATVAIARTVAARMP